MDFKISDLLQKALRLEFLSAEEGLFLFENAATAELMYVGNAIKQHHVPHNKVTWIIDRNSNTTNVCVANCKFCNFYRCPGHEEAYITTIEDYKQKIEETFSLGGEQFLLQGGHHPDLGLSAAARRRAGGTCAQQRAVPAGLDGAGAGAARAP